VHDLTLFEFKINIIKVKDFSLPDKPVSFGKIVYLITVLSDVRSGIGSRFHFLRNFFIISSGLPSSIYLPIFKPQNRSAIYE